MRITSNDNFIILSGNTNIITFISNNDKCVEFALPCETTNITALDVSEDNNYVLVSGDSPLLTYIDVKSQKSVTTKQFFDIAQKIQYLQSPDAFYMSKELTELYHSQI